MRSWASLLASPSLRVQTGALGSQVLLGASVGGARREYDAQKENISAFGTFTRATGRLN